MSFQDRLDAFRANFDAGGPPYNAPEWIHEPMHRATAVVVTGGSSGHALATAKRFVEMSVFSALHVWGVLHATPTLARVFDAAARRWRWLTTSLFDPYRPELHYMRGPGPKYREKQARGAGR